MVLLNRDAPRATMAERRKLMKGPNDRMKTRLPQSAAQDSDHAILGGLLEDFIK